MIQSICCGVMFVCTVVPLMFSQLHKSSCPFSVSLDFLILCFCRLHSAGHLLDICMRNVGLTYLEPGKGYHFSDGYVAGQTFVLFFFLIPFILINLEDIFFLRLCIHLLLIIHVIILFDTSNMVMKMEHVDFVNHICMFSDFTCKIMQGVSFLFSLLKFCSCLLG